MISRTLGSSRKFALLTAQAGKLAEFAQTLYPLLVTCADDFGRQSGDAFTVKHAVFSSSLRREAEFDRALDAMHAVGLIQRFDVNGAQVIQIVDFDEHQPGLSKRTKSKFPDPPPGNFTGAPGISRLARARGTELNRTEQKRTEGKRTEGKRTEEEISSVPHAAHEPAVRLTQEAVEPREQRTRTQGAVEPRESEDDAGVVLRFPVVGTNGNIWRLTEQQVKEWCGFYPNLDIMAEARKALAWILASPQRRKTSQGMPKFLVGWLSRATDRGRGGGTAGGKTSGNLGNALQFLGKGKPP